MASESRRVGWGRTVVSTYWHWFDDESDDGPDAVDADPEAPIRCVCETIGSYRGKLVPEIARWENDPSICEICRDIRTARAEGRVSKAEPVRLVAIVPVGLPDRIRAVMESLANVNVSAPPFYVALSQFRSEGVTKPFLSALLRADAEHAGKKPRTRLKWWDVAIEEFREVEGVTRVRIEREPKISRRVAKSPATD